MAIKITTISPNATYSVDGSLAAVDEGSQVTITLNTAGVQNGQLIPYTISGSNITTSDFVALPSLSNNFTVQNNTAIAILTLSNDALTEGTESFTVSVPSGDTVSVNVNDTSITTPTYPSTLWRTLANPDVTGGGGFGRSIAMSNSYIIVGSFWDSTVATESGVAHIFDVATGSLVRTIANPTPAAYDAFGISVAISGNYAVVGAHYDNTTGTKSGSAYVFDVTTGALVWTLANPTPATNDNFGGSVAISGNYIVVGATYDDPGVTDTGRAYVFDVTTGALVSTLANPTPEVFDLFGASVAISGNYAVAGAQRNDETQMSKYDVGAAYVFNATTGALVSSIANPTPLSFEDFGHTVAISGNYVVVGAAYDNVTGSSSGSAYVFDAATGVLVSTLVNPSPAASDLFGMRLAISGTSVIVGTMYDDTDGADSGRAYIFDAATGALISTLVSPTPAVNDYFGAAVAISGNYAVVGAMGDDTTATNGGSVYVYH